METSTSMRILLTNDDGFNADGIKSLKKIALDMTTEENIFIIAPSENQSAKSRSITYKTDFEIIKKSSNDYCVGGTPTDCIIFALDHLMKNKKPDLLLSGINWGNNLAGDVFYSGTVAAALEGAERGILSIALSQAYYGEEKKINPYLFAEGCGSRLCLSIYENFSNTNEKMAFNVNFPSTIKTEYPKCLKVTPAGSTHKSNSVINIKAKSKNSYTAKIDSINTNLSSAIENDYINCMNGYITVSPVSMHVNKESNLDKLKKVQF